MGSKHFSADAAAVARAAKKARALARKTYVPEDEKVEEEEQRRREELQEARESMPHAGDRSYMELGNEGTYQRIPMRYDE